MTMPNQLPASQRPHPMGQAANSIPKPNEPIPGQGPMSHYTGQQAQHAIPHPAAPAGSMGSSRGNQFAQIHAYASSLQSSNQAQQQEHQMPEQQPHPVQQAQPQQRQQPHTVQNAIQHLNPRQFAGKIGQRFGGGVGEGSGEAGAGVDEAAGAGEAAAGIGEAAGASGSLEGVAGLLGAVL